MLRSIFVGLSKNAWAQRLISSWGFARRAAHRFVAGESHAEAIEAVRQLNLRQIHATLDHLGENTKTAGDARAAAQEIIDLLDAIQASGVRANVSIKLSQIGLILDEALCRSLLFEILDHARALGSFIRIDMEDSTLTQRTLGLYFAALENGYAENSGIVLQAYLFSTADDLAKVLERGGRVRLCKGAYQEPAGVAFPRKQDADLNYDRLAEQLLSAVKAKHTPALSGDGRRPPVPAFATHDAQRIEIIKRAVETLGLGKNRLEFQMLYGIRRNLQLALAAEGYPVRVYVPYGTHWYPYFMRRLGERPANIWFFVSNFFRS